MARPLRVERAGGWYHVTSRGIERRAIATDERCHEHFCELLESMVEQFRVKVHAYVLMGNHYHLVVETPEANLSRAVQWLNVSYVAWFNRRAGRVGPLMQGRFKAILVEDANWARELSLYVHLNPVMRKGMGLDKRGKKAESQGLRGASPEENARRQQALRAYRWSSYRAYAGYARKPKWLTTAEILARGPDDARRREAAYRQEVQSRLLKGGDSTVAESIRDRFAVGSERFRASILKVVKGGREVTVPAGLQIRANWQDILRAVETVTGVPSSDYLAKRGMRGKPLALWAARQCGAMTLREIGREAGGMDYAAVSISIKRLEALAQTDRQVRCEMEEVKRLLNVET